MTKIFLINLIKALGNAITKEEGHTDLIRYLMYDLYGEDNNSLKRKKLRSKIEETLPEIWSKDKDKEDRRRVQFNLNALHELYTNAVYLCQNHNTLSICEELVKTTLIRLILENLKSDYNIDGIKNELNKVVSPPKRDDNTMVFGFMTNRNINNSNLIDRVDNDSLKQELEMINKLFNLLVEEYFS